MHSNTSSSKSFKGRPGRRAVGEPIGHVGPVGSAGRAGPFRGRSGRLVHRAVGEPIGHVGPVWLAERAGPLRGRSGAQGRQTVHKTSTGNTMIGRADIEGSKSNVAMNAWLPQASYPCGNFSGTSSLKCRGTKGSIGHTFMVCIHTENQNQGNFYPFVLLEISVLHESPLGHLRYGLTDVPPQPNSPPDNVFNPGRPAKDLNTRSWSKNQPRFIE